MSPWYDTWPGTAEQLIAIQQALSRQAAPDPWHPPDGDLLLGGCFVCFPRGHQGTGQAGDPAWAAAVLYQGRRCRARYVTTATARGSYQPGLLALREGPLLEAAVRGLPRLPDVLLVNATGRDHPRRAGLAVHLGAVLEVPTVGITHRPLLAEGHWPRDARGAASPLLLDGEVVGAWVCTRPGTRPLAVHAGWRTDPQTASAVVCRCWCPRRTPEPLRQARRLARTTRAVGCR